MSDLTNIILSNLAYNDKYSRKVFPFLDEKYFEQFPDKIVFRMISNFIKEYNTTPTKDAIVISLDKRTDLNEETYKNCLSLIGGLAVDENTDENWLVSETENYCKDRAVYNAIMESIHIIDGKSQTKTENSIPEILSDALSVSFDAHIGHDYIEDADERYEFYHQVENKVPFDLDYFNRITNGGTPQKTLNIVMAGTGVGKSLFLCHHAAGCLSQNMNVLYITCEMAEERIAERIDANLFDITIDEVRELPKEIYKSKLRKVSEHVKSAVAGSPNDSLVSSSPISLLLKPCLFTCVAENMGTDFSTASPLSSSAIDLMKVYEFALPLFFNLEEMQMLR